MKNGKSVQEKKEESQIRLLAKALLQSGIEVRREQLARGHSFRVKSGDCLHTDRSLLFVDRRLPLSQQLSVLVDYIVDKDLQLPSEVIGDLSAQTRSLLVSEASQ